jgi:uncharacterized protein
MTYDSSGSGPVKASARFFTIDVLRGFACLGILLMNMPTFGLPEAAYQNPLAWGENGTSPANLWTLILVYVLGEGKMRAIFSMMFGASAMLLIGRGEERGDGTRVADVYFRRTLWLLLFGMIHGYLIWWGDILFPYAFVGLTLWAFRKLTPRTLLIVATTQLLVLTAMMSSDIFETRATREKYQKVQSLDLESTTLTDQQKGHLEAGIRLEKRQSLAEIRKKAKEEVEAYQGNYLKNLKKRAATTWNWHQFPIYFPFLWDMLAMMFVGMAFYKLGVLTGDKPAGFYWQMAAIGGFTGLAINGFTIGWMVKHNFDPIQTSLVGWTYELGRVPMALCYVGLLVLAVKSGAFPWATRRLAAVGQMAFSNYISHSLICSTLFYGGYGFGLTGKLERWQLYVIVLAIWTFNLTWSPWWLKRYHFGPLEWCWRSLTYWKRQPWRIRPLEPVAASEMIAEPAETVPVPAPVEDTTSEAPPVRSDRDA